MGRTYKATGIVLKRFNYAEADRIVTIYTKEAGKVTALAKGVRKLKSKKAGSIEPASLAIFYFAKGRGSLDILTQTQLISSFQAARNSLVRLTQVNQILEVVDLITPEKQENSDVFHILNQTLSALNHTGSKKMLMLENTRRIIKALGFTYDKQFSEQGLKNYIEELAERRLHTKPYLTTQGINLE